MNKCFTAIRELNLGELEDFLKTGNINIKDDGGKTLLIYSVIYNFEEAFDLLIKNYININTVDNEGNSALVYSIIYNRIGYFKRLVREGANLNSINARKETPIMIALNKNRDQMAKILFDSDVDLSITNVNDENIFFALVKSHNLDYLEDLLDSHKNFLKSKNFTNRTLLHQAVMLSDYNITKYLLEEGIPANSMDNFHETPIFFAIRNKDKEIISLLMDYGALLEGRNNFFESPLEIAEPGVLDFLKYKMNGVKYSRYIKKYPLHVAVQTNDFIKVKLHANYYNMKKKDDYGITPIEYAKMLDLTEIYNYLRQQNKDYTN